MSRCGLATAALLVCLVVPVPIARPAPTPDAAITAHADADGLAIELTNVGVAGGYVAIIHEDPLIGPVVDRLVRVEKASGGTVEVKTEPLRGNTTFTAAFIPGEALLPRAAPLANLPDATGTLLLATATTVLRPVAAWSATRAFIAYPVADGRSHDGNARIIASDGGALSTISIELGPYAAQPTPSARIRIVTSLDGGVTWRPPIYLDPPETSHETVMRTWTATGLPGGLLAVIDDLRRDGQAARLTLYDPILGRIVQAGVVGSSFEVTGLMAVVSRADGDMILFASDATWDGGSSAFGAFRLETSGRIRFVQDISAPTPWNWGFSATTSGTGVLAAVWTSYDTISYVVSADEGNTFGPARGVPIAEAGQKTLESAQLDDDGTLHVTAQSQSAPGQLPRSIYARIPLDKAPQTRYLCLGPEAIVPTCEWGQYPRLAVQHGRVWLLFSRWPTEGHGRYPQMPVFSLLESDTGGATFQQPLWIEDYPNTRLSVPYDFAMLPDGRPALFAFAFFGGSGGENPLDAVVPFFEPLHPPTFILNGTIAAPSFSDAPETPQIVIGDLPSVIVAGPDGTVRVAVRNDGAAPIAGVNVSVSLVRADGSKETAVSSPLTLVPGGQVSLGPRVAGPEGTQVRLHVVAAVGPAVLVQAERFTSILPQSPSERQNPLQDVKDDSQRGEGHTKERLSTPLPPLTAWLAIAACVWAIRRHG